MSTHWTDERVDNQGGTQGNRSLGICSHNQEVMGCRKDPGGSADSFNRVITPPRAWSGGERDRARRVNLVIINPDSKHKSYMAWAEWTPGSALSGMNRPL